MARNIEISQASIKNAEEVFALVYPLLIELYPNEPTYTQENIKNSTARLLQDHPEYYGFVAYRDNEPIGYIGLNACASIYAFGKFGEIAELYVKPEFRNESAGAALVKHAIQIGKNQQWSMLEVGAPSVPEWNKTVNFYQRNGFEIVGPRLYKVI